MELPAGSVETHETELERLHRRYRTALMAFFMRRSASVSDAEDMTQDVFVRLAQSGDRAGTVGPISNADAYIFQIAANILRDRARRERVRYTAAPEIACLSDIEALDPMRFLVGREQLSGVVTYLYELSERTRTLFILFRVDGIPQAQLAATYGISTRAVQKHLMKAMNHLMLRLYKQEAGNER